MPGVSRIPASIFSFLSEPLNNLNEPIICMASFNAPFNFRANDKDYTPYSKMAADLCGYKLALVAWFKIKFSFEFKLKNEASRANLNKNKRYLNSGHFGIRCIGFRQWRKHIIITRNTCKVSEL